MEIMYNNCMPGDTRLVQKLVYELKSQGIFDHFRKECIADVDTKPAYQNLRQRVEGTVTTFLTQQTWSIDLNKNQLREQLRKNLFESGFLETGVERIVDQVVNPKISSVFLPKVEEVVYRFLGVEKPATRNVIKEEKKVSITDLLPTDLEAVSPDSVDSIKNVIKTESINGSLPSSGKMEEDESPPFEPLVTQNNQENVVSLDNKMQIDDTSRDSHLSGFSGLQSHESCQDSDLKSSQMDLSNQDSQNSSETRLSIITSEDTTKMEICEDSNAEIKDKVDTKSQELDVKPDTENSFNFTEEPVENSAIENLGETVKKEKKHEKVEDKLKKEESIETSATEKLGETGKKDKKHEKVEDKKSSRSSEKSRDRKDDKYKKSSSSSKDKEKSSSKHSSHKDSKDRDANKRDSKSSSSSRDKDKDRSKDKNDKDKSSKHKSDKDKEKSRSDKDKKVEKSKSDKDIANKAEKEKSEKEKDKIEKEKSEKDKLEKEKSEKEKTDKSRSDKSKHDKDKSHRDKDKHKSDREKSSKDKERSRNKDKTEKDRSSKSKDKSDRDKDKSSKDKSSKEVKDKKEIDKDATTKSSSSSSSTSTKHSSSKEKRRESSSHSSRDKSNSKDDSKSSEKTKKDDRNSNGRKDSKKKSKDDHYSSKIKKNDRRSTDRDSNDGTSNKNNHFNSNSDSVNSKSENNSQDYSNSSFSGGSGDSGNSDRVESAETHKSEINLKKSEVVKMDSPAVAVQVQPLKYIKPKFASNFEEARKIMKIRKQLAKLERENQLTLSRIEVPSENGIADEEKMSICETNDGYVPSKEIIAEKSDNILIAPEENSIKTSNDNKNLENEISPFKSKEISMENFEALEAKLAQVMSKINCNSYESDEDYEFKGYNSSDIVVDIPKQFESSLNNKVKLTEEMQLLNQEIARVQEYIAPIKSEDTKDVKPTECVDIVESPINDSPSKTEHQEVQKVNNCRKLSVCLNNLSTAATECRYLETPTLNEEKNLKYLHGVVDQLQREINECIETSQNNFCSGKRGVKRKFEECVDVKNNNTTDYLQTVKKRRGSASANTVVSKANKKRMCQNTDITPNEHFSLPLSPAESDKSNERKEEDLLIPMKQKRILRGYSQRYSSEELYKPRPVFARRNKFPRNAD